MQASEYEKAILAATTWRLARSTDVNELIAISCVLRNWVVPRYGAQTEPMREAVYFASYGEAAEEFLEIYPTRALPYIKAPALIDPSDGLLARIDSVYDCTLADMTSSRNFPAGARYFGRSSAPSTWFHQTVLARQDVHPLIGTFGSQQFYA